MADQLTGLLSPYLRRLRVRRAGRYLSGGAVLDFGCGIGPVANLVDPDRYLGVDVDGESLRIARSLHPTHSFVTPDEFMARSSETFDVVVALAVIEHLEDPEGWLVAMKDHLESGGVICATTPHPSFRWLHETGAWLGLCSREAAEEHNEFFDRPKLERFARSAGLEVTRYERFLLGANQLFELRVVAG